MQQHPRQWTARPLATVRTATQRPRQQIAALQECLRPAVAPRKPVIANQMLVEMPCRETLIARPIQRLHLITAIHRNSLARRLAYPTVQQSSFALFLIPATPATECPLSHPQQLRRFQLAQRRCLPATKHIHELQHTNTLTGRCPPHLPTLPVGGPLPDSSCAT